MARVEFHLERAKHCQAMAEAAGDPRIRRLHVRLGALHVAASVTELHRDDDTCRDDLEIQSLADQAAVNDQPPLSR